MKKNVLIIIIAIFFTWLGISFAFQTNKVSEQEKLIEIKESEIEELNLSLDEEVERSAQLFQENQLLLDSIQKLNEKIVQLEQKLVEKNKHINYLKGKLKRRDVAIQDLKDEIALLYRQRKLDHNKIAALEKQKAKIDKEKSKVLTNYNEELFAAKSVDKEISTHRQNIAQMQMISDITKNTKVIFEKIEGKKFKAGRTISNMKKNTSGWQHTRFKFKLQHPNHRVLLDKQFVLKVFDKESNLVLAYSENHPQHQSAINNGIPFSFDGNIVDIIHTNHQRKSAENYEIKIYVMYNGQEFELEQGSVTFIENGSFLLKS